MKPFFSFSKISTDTWVTRLKINIYFISVSFFSVIFFFICLNPFAFKITINFYKDFYDMQYEIHLNSILTSICLFRVWFIFKLYLVLSNSYSQRSFLISKINNIKIGLMFPFKEIICSSSIITTFDCFFS